MQTELELQLHKELETLEEANNQYTRTERQLDQLEDDALWRNRRSKELNDELFERYPQDKKLQQILARGEELLQRQILVENNCFQECRENLREMKKKAEQQMDDYREELRKLREDKSDEDNNYDYPAPTR